MNLKDFIAIKGKSDLYRIIVRTPKGIIVETLNETKIRFKVESTLQLLLLQDITVFSNDNTELYLRNVFINIFKKDGLNISVDQKDEVFKLKEYFKEVAPNHDEEKVYISDIKKMIKWYGILTKWHPDVIENLEKEELEKDNDQPSTSLTEIEKPMEKIKPVVTKKTQTKRPPVKTQRTTTRKTGTA